MEPWQVRLAQGNIDAAWDLFMESYRPLILKTIRHTISDADDLMDAFAEVCATLSAEAMARLNGFGQQGAHTAKFSSWLVVVVRNHTVDWLRKERGRPRVRVPDSLSELERRVFELVFVDRAGHGEAYERLRAGGWPDLSFSSFLKVLRAVYRLRGSRGASAARRSLAAAPLVDDAPLADQLVLAEETSALVRAALDSLSAQDRLAVQLFVLDGLPAAEVARTLGWRNAKMVYNRVYRALATIRARLERAGLEPARM